jgi:hypothetical protein
MCKLTFTKILVNFINDISLALDMINVSPWLNFPELGIYISSTPAAMFMSPRLDHFQKIVLLSPRQMWIGI